jgi:hypothetical protein
VKRRNEAENQARSIEIEAIVYSAARTPNGTGEVIQDDRFTFYLQSYIDHVLALT